MITEQDIRNLLASGYQQAALKEGVDMRLVAEVLERLRIQMLHAQPYDVFKKLALHKEQFDKEGIRQILLQLKKDYFNVLFEKISDEIRRASVISPEKAWDRWMNHYAEALINWTGNIYIRLTEEKYKLPQSSQKFKKKLKNLNRWIMESRWIDAYPLFELLLKQKNLNEIQQAYLLVNLGKIELYYMAGYKSPLEQFEKAKQKAGEQSWLMRANAEYYNKNGDLTKSREYINSAICMDDRDLDNYLLMGDTYRDEKKHAIAEQWYFDAMKLNFLEPDPIMKLANLYGDPVFYSEKKTFIPDLVAEIESLDPDNEYSNSCYIAYKDLATFCNLNKSNEDSDAYYKKAIETRKDWISAYIEYAYTLILQERYDEARDNLEKAKDLDPDSFDVWFAMAWLAEKTANLSEAIAHYKKCAKLRPMFSDGIFNTIGVLYGERNNYHKSKQYYNKAIAVIDTKSLYYSNLGYANRKLENYDDAEKAYSKAIELEPGNPEYHNNLGNVYYARNKWEEAKSSYLKAIDLNEMEAVYHENLGLACDHLSDFIGARKAYESASALRPCKENFNLFGIACYNLGQHTEAVEYYKKAIELGGEDAVYFNNIGLAQVKAKNYDQAIEAFTKAIRLDPVSYKYINSLGNIYFELEDYESAVEKYRQAISVHKEDPVVFENLGLSFERMERYIEAEEAYIKMIAAGSGDATYYNRLGILYYRLKRYDNAIHYYMLAIEKNPSVPIYWENLGLAYEDAEKLSEAKKAFSQLIKLSPLEPDPHFRLAMIHVKEGNQEEALNTIRKGVNYDPENFELLKLQGQYEENAGIYQDALETYNKALHRHPLDEYFNNRAGICCHRLGDDVSAIDYYLKAIDFNPSIGIYYANLGLSYSVMGEIEKSIVAFEKAVELSPTKDNHNSLGVAYYKNSEHDKAIDHYKQALDIGPHDAVVFSNLALAYDQTGDYEDGQKAMEQALKLDPGNYIYYNQLGTLYTVSGKFRESIPCFQQAISHGQHEEVLYENLAFAFENLGDRVNALETYKQALELHPDNLNFLTKISALDRKDLYIERNDGNLGA